SSADTTAAPTASSPSTSPVTTWRRPMAASSTPWIFRGRADSRNTTLVLRAAHRLRVTPPQRAGGRVQRGERDVWNLGLRPRRVRIERLHRDRELTRARSEILLKDNAVVIDEEGHHARDAVARGERDQPEAADHVPLRDVVVRALSRRRSLRGQDAI